MHVDRAVYKQLKDKYQDEMVYVIPHHLMQMVPDGYTPQGAIDHAWVDRSGRFVHRYDAEENKAFQQLIPYVLIRNKKGKYFVAERLAGDERLEGKKTLGFGGHLEPADGLQNIILNGLHRELHEELVLGRPKDPMPIGTVRHLGGPTFDHTGVVFEMEVTSARIKETGKLKGRWMTAQELIEDYFHFESWSRMYIDHLYETGHGNA